VGDVADVGHRLQNGRQLDAAVVPAHPRAAGGVVDLDREHAGQRGDVALVEPDARGADDVFQDQRGLADVLGFRPNEAFLDFRQVVQPHLRQFGLGLLGRRGEHGAVGVIRALAAVDDGLRHRLAAATAGLFGQLFELDGVMGAVGDRQATVEAVRRKDGGVHELRRAAHDTPRKETPLRDKSGREVEPATGVWNHFCAKSATAIPSHGVNGRVGMPDADACGFSVVSDGVDVVCVAILLYRTAFRCVLFRQRWIVAFLRVNWPL